MRGPTEVRLVPDDVSRMSPALMRGARLPMPPRNEVAPVSTQMTPIPGVPEGRPSPQDWTPPGDHIKGFFPGDPNVYPDPENPQQSY